MANLNKEDAAARIGVSVRTLQRITKAGEIPVSYERGKKGDEARYDEADLLAYLEKTKPHALMRPAATPDATSDTALVKASQMQETLGLLASMLEDRRLLDDRFLTYAQASDEFGLSMAVLRRAVAQEKLKLYPVGKRGAKVLRLSEVRAFVRSL
jgi:predicted DNA-binding protein (UPF0251 family)